jgi:hypothetical protein
MRGRWPFGPSSSLRRQVRDKGMEARLTPRALLCVAGIAAVAAAMSGCGGGAGAQAASKRPLPARYASPSLSFVHPAAWQAYPFRWPGELHFRPLVYLSTQRVENPCSTQGNTTKCGFPVQRLRPGGVLITWNASGPPASALGPGAQITLDGRPARRLDATGGTCRAIGADRTIDVLVATRPLPSTLMELTACLRGPGLAQNVKRVDALLASTKFLSQ